MSLSALACIASAATSSYTVTFHASTVVEGKVLKPGDYKVVVDGGNATFKDGKTEVQAHVTSEQNAAKYGTTSVSYEVVDGKYNVEEIHIGGSATKLVFAAHGASSGN